MSSISIIAFILFLLSGISSLIHAQLILTRLDNMYPKLYEKLGKPELFTSNWFRGIRTNFVIIRMIFSEAVPHKGDQYLGRLLVGLRLSFAIVFVAWLGLIVSAIATQK